MNTPETTAEPIVPRGTSMGELPERCTICGGKDLALVFPVVDHFLSKEHFNIAQCRTCGLWATHPVPPPDQLSKYYESPEYLSHADRPRGVLSRIYGAVRNRAIRGKHRLMSRHVPKGRVLDMGCGTGEFLAYLNSRGYQVEGVEPSLRAREQAIASHGLRVLPALEHLPHQEHYQAITLWHVLEHMPNLRDTMKRLYALLADRGVLIIAVPDRESWDAQHYGPLWAAWDVPRHVHHFRRKDVARLLEEHGFSLLEVRRMPWDAYYVALLSERYNGHAFPIAAMLALLKGTWSNLKAMSGKRPSSSSLFLARKLEP